MSLNYRFELPTYSEYDDQDPLCNGCGFCDEHDYCPQMTGGVIE